MFQRSNQPHGESENSTGILFVNRLLQEAAWKGLFVSKDGEYTITLQDNAINALPLMKILLFEWN